MKSTRQAMQQDVACGAVTEPRPENGTERAGPCERPGTTRTCPRTLYRPEFLFRGAARLAVRGRLRTGWAGAMAANQQVVHSGRLDQPALTALVRSALITRLRAHYEMLLHDRSPQVMESLVIFSREIENSMEALYHGGRGVVVVGPHTGNFDLMGRAMIRRWPRLMALVAADARRGYVLENRRRRQDGFHVLPVSAPSWFRAVGHLESGGIVVTGMDRPYPGMRRRPLFFGRPAALPTTPVRLAAAVGAPLVILAAPRDESGHYRVTVAGPFTTPAEERRRPGATDETARAVFSALEQPIRDAPAQWTMFKPVWPDTGGTP